MPYRTSIRWLPLAWLFAFISILALTGSAQAGPINELPENLGNALEVDPQVAGFILAAGVIIAVALPLAKLRFKPLGIFMVLIVVMGVLTIINWLQTWVMILATIVAVAMFAGTMGDIFK